MKKLILSIAMFLMGMLSAHAETYPQANQVVVNTSSFTKNLNSTDTNVQKALNTIDQISTGGGGGGTPGGSNTQYQYNNNGNFAGGKMYQVGNFIGVNQPAPAYQLDVSGIINSTGGYVGIQASNVPTLNQNTTGTAAGISGTQNANSIYAGPNGSPGTASFRSLVGADLPNPSASSKGGVQSIAQISHNWINSISTSGVPLLSQPTYSDISGSVPAITSLTGDVTGSGTGAVATTLATVNSNVGTFQGLTINGKGLVTAATNQGYITGNQPITWTGSGDVTGTATGATSITPTLTLATVNSNTGSFGSSTAIPNFTVNGKGLITAAGTNVVVAPASTLTGNTLASGVTISSLTTIGTITTGTWNGTPIGYQYGGLGLTTAPLNDLAVGNGTGWTLTPIGSCSGATSALTYNTSTSSFGCNSLVGGVSSVSNSDGSLTISPNTGAVVASLNVAHSNIFTGQQIFNNANVGIGTTTTPYNLTINGNSTNTSTHTPNLVGGVRSTAGYNIDPTGAGNLLYMPASRNVGIGTWNPGQLLDVAGTVRSTEFYGSGAGLTSVSGTGWSQGTNTVYTTAGAGTNVGIGSTTPRQALDVQGTVIATQFVGGGAGITGISGSISGLTPDYIQEAATSTTLQNSPLYDNQLGNVGIGTANPGKTLDVQGTVRASNFTTSNNMTMGTGTMNGSLTFNSGSISMASGAVTMGSTGFVSNAASSNSAFSSNDGGLGSGTLANFAPTAVTSGTIMNASTSSSTFTGVAANVGITSGSSSAIALKVTDAGTGPAVYVASGNVGIGTLAPTNAFVVKGSYAQVWGTNIPVATSCGTSPTVVGTDNDFQVTVGSVSATGCTLTFGGTYNGASCVVTNQSQSITNAMTYTVSSSAIVVSQTGLTGDILNIHCGFKN